MSLAFADASFELVYISHVLHHLPDHRAAVGEAYRVLKPGGVMIAIETVDDSPGIRFARRVYDRWDSDVVHSRFRFADLRADVEAAGFRVEDGEPFNVVYWIWDVAQIRVPALSRLVGMVEWAERAAVRRWRRFGAHAFVLARKPSVREGANGSEDDARRSGPEGPSATPDRVSSPRVRPGGRV
jgi:SAM-dependent methyltransferase